MKMKGSLFCLLLWVFLSSSQLALADDLIVARTAGDCHHVLWTVGGVTSVDFYPAATKPGQPTMYTFNAPPGWYLKVISLPPEAKGMLVFYKGREVVNANPDATPAVKVVGLHRAALKSGVYLFFIGEL